MKNRLSSIVLVCLLVTVGFLGFITFESNVVSAGKTWYVGSGAGNDSADINGGIGLAQLGDTVFVYSGVYLEFFWIDKTINLIGEDRNTTIIDGMGENVVRILSTEWVNITGFTITNGSTGILIVSSSFINIQGNEIYGNGWGIQSGNSSNNTYINNIVHDQIKIGGLGGTGFFFSGTPYSNNKIIGNVVYNNAAEGIHLEDQTSPDELIFWNNSIINNTVYNNTGDGICIYLGTNNFVIDNIVHHNGLNSINPSAGIRISSSLNNTITRNTVHDNENGIMLELGTTDKPSKNNTITGNTVYNNENGIRLSRSKNNTFIENSIFNNNHSVYMFFEWGENYGGIGNNFINCTLTNASINVYIGDQSTDNNFINCTLSNARINVYMEKWSGNNNFINSTLSNASKDDFNLTEDSHAILLNTTFNKTRVYYGDTLSSLTVKWFMHVKVIYWNGSPASGADIWVNDTSGIDMFFGQVDSQGWTRWIVVTEYIEQDTDGDHIGNRFYYTPHDVTATDGNLWGYAYPNMDISKVVVIILGAPPPLLPPTNLTTKIVNNGNNVELEWDPPSSLALDHYLIYMADSAIEFDFTTPYNSSTTWPDPKNTTWVDPDSNITAVDDDFYYIVRSANFDESDVSLTSNTAGVWTRTFQPGVSTFSLPLEPFAKKDTEFYCQDMNASYIKWMNQTTHTWMRHDRGSSENNTIIEVGEGYEIGFLGKSIQTKYTFIGFPGAMILYDNISFGFDATPLTGDAESLIAKVNSTSGTITLNWTQPTNIGSGDQYYVLRSSLRDGFWGTEGINYTQLAVLPFDVLSYQDIGNATLGTEYYYMILPVNLSTGERGVSSYSIGVWTAGYLDQYDTFALPLKPGSNQTADWYCDNIPDTIGINYYIYSEQRWGWHSTRMPAGAYDPLLVMAEGYQISTSNVTKFTFIGR